MERTLNRKFISVVMTAFLIGGICGYQYHVYTVKRDIQHFLGVPDQSDKATKNEMDKFLDMNPDKKQDSK